MSLSEIFMPLPFTSVYSQNNQNSDSTIGFVVCEGRIEDLRCGSEKGLDRRSNLSSLVNAGPPSAGPRLEELGNWVMNVVLLRVTDY